MMSTMATTAIHGVLYIELVFTFQLRPLLLLLVFLYVFFYCTFSVTIWQPSLAHFLLDYVLSHDFCNTNTVHVASSYHSLIGQINNIAVFLLGGGGGVHR